MTTATARASPSPLLNGTGQHATDAEDSAEAGWRALLLFGASVAVGAVVCAGGLYSLASVPRMRARSPLCLIVACLSVDDLIGVVPLALAAVLQWRREGHGKDGDDDAAVCTWAGLLYVFHGLASNMKACLIAAYTLYASRRRRGARGARAGARGGVPCALAAVWAASLAVSALPLGGWGRFSRASLGCLPARDGFYAPLLVALYALCACGLAACSAPLTHQLLCSADALRPLCRWEGGGGGAASAEGPAAPLCEVASVSRESLERSYGELGSGAAGSECGAEACPCSRGQFGGQGVRHCPVVFAQKRFSMILAMARIVLWMPMMAQILVSHTVQMHSSSLETLCFFLTLLSAAVTPVFVLSERWIHLPCGCFINCRRGSTSTSISSTSHKRRFEFNLSFQQGYGIYKIPHVTSPSVEKPSYNSLYNCDFSESRIAVLDSGQIANLAARELRSPGEAEDCSLHSELLLDAVSAESRREGLPQLSSGERDGFGSVSPPVSACDGEDLNLDASSVFDGPERRLSHEECRKIELTDWEWCRSKSERTPRQRSAGAGGLAIPLCAFQGTVSLHAPTGKTLSLSTYEVSSDGLKISPNNAKKVEVYRSKSVGHEPSADEPNSSGSGGGGAPAPGGVADTNVKIHLEVLEICDNEEAMDSVSIVSNISQSSAHARSPSLRYSRRENRFVSCDLGETASYSLLIPTNPDADSINIHIPDTVEAHRQNSRRQRQDAGGYREEIQLLNEVYRRQGGDLGD
ncbi:probable G-protein coupled receptor 149 [Colossoma macropomum]|uniref:probable G-protein coupled receptor 149 n=1 Tax=Colossoma macropomum TaxID=42526 RepID=UPI001864E658|nr:probable G-protein coupled receptor 149 [Colossoma macropomum]